MVFLNLSEIEPASSSNANSIVRWFKRLHHRNQKQVQEQIFGRPLQYVVNISSVALFVKSEDNRRVLYGHVPTIVAKCGYYLKQNATNVKGIFRINGSSKRIRKLEAIFNSAPSYGRDVDWSEFTVHDAATILRQFLKSLPERVIPSEHYFAFRQVMLLTGTSDENKILMLERLMDLLPRANHYVLLYILDLLSVFALKASRTLMTARNLAAIFQPGVCSHPSHDNIPEEYFASQELLLFLIKHQEHFLRPRTELSKVSHRKLTEIVTKPHCLEQTAPVTIIPLHRLRRHPTVPSKKTSLSKATVDAKPSHRVFRSKSLNLRLGKRSADRNAEAPL
ncbi:rho-type GTPase activating protein Rga5 [Schizosaccharomyces japonicus yFS275]|uniref:Rho-type GTPase activating protein Rga5 n=1 Tax=Schizosaccharomyces japonicus (strain yFS275 / FY16936) TaxID=402676 RepID=B6K6W2_SCHJY|nr:rho-type GTPase activating protein Rga5 [Schizosaccharomyces japonicus yFS275]EEB09266.1 rho-type GTPase activating protein Rga5 [Schizosaccharomyces japonicus yFS275]